MGSIVNVEKRRSNKLGLFLLIIVLLGLFSAGIYYLYKHPDIIERFKEKVEEVTKSKEGQENKKTSKDTKLKELDLNDTEIFINSKNNINSGFVMKITNVSITNEGYKVDISSYFNKYYNEDGERSGEEFTGNLVIKCTDVLIDGFSSGITFDLEMSGEEEKDTSFLIKKTLMNELGFNDINELKFYYEVYITYLGEQARNVNFYSQEKVNPKRLERLNNSINNGNIIGTKNDVNVYYYKHEIDRDNYYLYFIIDNKNVKYHHNIKLNKLIINGELYNYESLDVFSHYGSKKLFYIKVPRKKYNTINEFSVSFFIIANRKDIIDDEYMKEKNIFEDSIYITNQVIIKKV